jgi:serine/threonine protein kinase
MSDAVLPADEPALVGKVVSGKYRVLRPIGSGGMGTVWEGVHVNLGTRVAIKFIRPQFAMQAEARTRFEIEARAATPSMPSTSTITDSRTKAFLILSWSTWRGSRCPMP